MLYHLARDCFRGEGAIVDCGPFLGKSSAMLAQGLSENPRVGSGRRTRRVHSYDRFRICDDHDVWFIEGVTGLKLKVGDSSRQLFERQTARWSDLIAVHEGSFKTA